MARFDFIELSFDFHKFGKDKLSTKVLSEMASGYCYVPLSPLILLQISHNLGSTVGPDAE